MEDDEGNEDGLVRVTVTSTIEADDAKRENWIYVPVTMATVVEDEASQEGSIPVTQVSEEDVTNLVVILLLMENGVDDEYWSINLIKIREKQQARERR